MVGDFNLQNVDWVNSLGVSPVNSISQHFRRQDEYLDLFTTKGLYWFIEEEEDTRRKLVRNRLDKDTLNLFFFSKNEGLIGDVSLIALLGKSDHASIEIEVKPDFNYTNRKQRNKSKSVRKER